MEDSSSSSSDSSSRWKGDRVVMCSVANREPALTSREFDPRPFLQSGGCRQGVKLDSNSRGVALARDAGFDYSTLLHLRVPEWSKGVVCKTISRGFESHPGVINESNR